MTEGSDGEIINALPQEIASKENKNKTAKPNPKFESDSVNKIGH